MSNEKLTAVAVASGAVSAKQLTLASPEVFKAMEAACGAEEAAIAKWVSLAGKLYQCNIRFKDMEDEKGQTYLAVKALVVQAQKPGIITLLSASSTIGFTEQERSDRTHWKNRVEKVYLPRIKQHLKKFEDSEGKGPGSRKSLGEGFADKCQDMIDRIRREKEDNIDFDAVDAVNLLKDLKACFLA